MEKTIEKPSDTSTPNAPHVVDCAPPPCSAFDLGRLAEMDRKRLEAEKLYDSANAEVVRWRNEAYRRWSVAVKLGEDWLALKRELGLLPNVQGQGHADP